MANPPTRDAFEPDRDCPLCPRLAGFRAEARARQPDWHNAPVDSFGDPNARLLIVGLAPGMQGANRTGRPFTGDYAGDLLYATLLEYGFAKGVYQARPDDGLKLIDSRISNAVRCVPPQNKPLPAEIRQCNLYLRNELGGLAAGSVILSLGLISHNAVLRALGLKASAFSFAHGAEHALPGHPVLLDSYHCSRYNTNTRRLTEEMFTAVFARARALLDAR